VILKKIPKGDSDGHRHFRDSGKAKYITVYHPSFHITN
jgi:hypothetical protein